ncbi:MAG TPA: hypothetical protein VL574_13565 [Stellaceae bacterium]|nr:hypothetical protein [Stellaceae bacterium]
MPKKNPLNLNPLQLKTLTLLQELGRALGNEPDGDGAVLIDRLPHAHGNHFHLGDAVVMTADASGLTNPAVWVVLERKGLLADNHFPQGAKLTQAGRDYDTGLSDKILHRSDH